MNKTWREWTHVALTRAVQGSILVALASMVFKTWLLLPDDVKQMVVQVFSIWSIILFVGILVWILRDIH